MHKNYVNSRRYLIVTKVRLSNVQWEQDSREETWPELVIED